VVEVGNTDAINLAVLAGLVAGALLMTFFAFRTVSVLFRVGAAVGWLAALTQLMVPQDSISFENYWCIIEFFAIFCFLVGVLLMYMGRTIKDSWVESIPKETRTRSQMAQENYKDQLRDRRKKR